MRLMVYSHDSFGLGNIRRMLAICHHLHAAIEGLSILIVSGSPMLQSFRVASGIDYIKLPCLKRDDTGELGAKFLQMETNEVVRLRRDLLLSTVISYRPDLILVDKKPDGLAGELEPALRHVRCSLPDTHVALVLRDILDAPEKTSREWQQRGYSGIVHWYYDQILILGSQVIFDVCAEYAIGADIRNKAQYCGYVARDETREGREKLRARLGVGRHTPLVLATTGGGEDGCAILLRSIEAAGALNRSQMTELIVVAGPELPLHQSRQLMAAAAKVPHTRVFEFVPDLISYMDAADVVVSMGGYNTICELATLDKPAVVVPRTTPVLEQFIRTERMRGYGAFTAIVPDQLNSSVLAEAVMTRLARRRSGARDQWQLDMGALPRIAQLVDELKCRQSLCSLRRNHSGFPVSLPAESSLDPVAC